MFGETVLVAFCPFILYAESLQRSGLACKSLVVLFTYVQIYINNFLTCREGQGFEIENDLIKRLNRTLTFKNKFIIKSSLLQ